ncbi:MAG: GNAT family N-acetyltransferase [Pseudorhizobium sp.]
MTEILRISPCFDRWDELLALIHSAFAYMDNVIDPPSSAKGLTAASLAEKAKNEIAFLAVEEGQLLGCIFCRSDLPDCLYIGKLAVHPDAQGKGLGRRLLAQAESAARQGARSQLRLETRIELTGNHATFAHWGFVKTAERSHPGYDRATYIEMVRMLDGKPQVRSG